VIVTRFAPSPTGPLHLGHAFAALTAWHEAARVGGRFVLRIDDLDSIRCRRQFEASIEFDLRWLGIEWPAWVRRQSACLGEYRAALDRLRELGVLYPCFCTRADVRREVAAAGEAPHGSEAAPYPGTCRRLDAGTVARRLSDGSGPVAWRLDVARASAIAGPLRWHDRRHGTFSADPGCLGDAVLGRKDITASYHLAVVVDDAAQGIALVTRGEDLLSSTHLHRLLQHLLGLPVPEWHHHRLVSDSSGHRLAKRNDALSLESLRAAGATPATIREQLGFPVAAVMIEHQ
jgi:glutamyl-Q tRNA(Asp) synthetase